MVKNVFVMIVRVIFWNRFVKLLVVECFFWEFFSIVIFLFL